MTHDERIHAIQVACAETTTRLAERLEALDDATATSAPAACWTPAQIAWHVALVNEVLAAALAGRVKSMQVPRPADFAETLATRQFPDKAKAPASAEPPADAARSEAATRLRRSADAIARAVATVTPDRVAAEAVRMPFGIFSLYEVGEFVAGHTKRHIRQLRQTVSGA